MPGITRSLNRKIQQTLPRSLPRNVLMELHEDNAIPESPRVSQSLKPGVIAVCRARAARCEQGVGLRFSKFPAPADPSKPNCDPREVRDIHAGFFSRAARRRIVD